MAEKIYTGSVKNIFQSIEPTDRRFGVGYMEYDADDPFSVFDYGKMPWSIQGKAEDLYKETLCFFKVLEDEGIPTHFTKDLGDRKIGIRLARMLGYDEIEPGKTIIYRIPIECVFTSVLTPVASLHGRLRSGKTKPGDYGLDRPPNKGETVKLPKVSTSFSTKIESTDVYKTLAEMAKVSGLVGNEPERLNELTIAAAEALIRDSEDTGLILADGKFEFIMGPGRNIIVADTGYTWDENRFLYELPGGVFVDLSKQLPRNIYTIMGWKKELKEAQQKYPENESKWPAPPELGDYEKKACVDACRAVRAAITRGPGCDRMLLDTAVNAQNMLDDLKDEHHRDETGEDV